jgi:chemotaxis protein histidine kinase CheA
MTEAAGNAEFLSEVAGYMDALDRETAEWGTLWSADSVHRALRAMHTLKGAAGFMGRDKVEALAHSIEELISSYAAATPARDAEVRLERIKKLATALRRELGIRRGLESDRAPDCRPEVLAGEAFVTLLRQGRRLATLHGKQVQVCLSGTKVALDARVAEVVRGPLGHVVRNAVAHAVEPPDERASRGKPYFATILVEVEQRAGELVIRVRDDGQGFDLAALRSRVVHRGLATAEQADALTTRQLAELAFLPGLSTAAEVNALAGRGVGLEAARAALEGAGGSLELSTERFEGTTVEMRIPQVARVTLSQRSALFDAPRCPPIR